MTMFFITELQKYVCIYLLRMLGHDAMIQHKFTFFSLQWIWTRINACIKSWKENAAWEGGIHQCDATFLHRWLQPIKDCHSLSFAPFGFAPK